MKSTGVFGVLWMLSTGIAILNEDGISWLWWGIGSDVRVGRSRAYYAPLFVL